MSDPIETIVRQVLSRSPIAARAQYEEPHYGTRVETTIGVLRAVHRASHGLLLPMTVERAVTDLLLHPEGLHVADLAMREQAIERRRAHLGMTHMPAPLLVKASTPADLLDLAREYGVEVSLDDDLIDVVRRIVEAARRG